MTINENYSHIHIITNSNKSVKKNYHILVYLVKMYTRTKVITNLVLLSIALIIFC